MTTTEDVLVSASAAAASRRVGVGAGRCIAGLVAAGTFLLAYAGGTYVEDRWTALAVAVWWTVLVALVIGVRGTRWPVAAVATTGLLAVFGGWTLASVAWAGDAEAAYAAFARVALYLGVLVIVVLLARRELVGFWADGLALGILAVAALALASRLYPDVVGSQAGSAYLSPLQSRLSYPVGYWNGLGILAGIGAPLVLGSALRARTPLARGLFIAGLPVLAGTIYLTSSRGAFATAVVGLLVFLALSRRRWPVLGTLLLGSAASGLAVLVLSSRAALANGLGGAAAASEARSASIRLSAICVLTVVAYLLARMAPRPRQPPGAVFGWALTGSIALAAVVVLAFAHPVRRFDEFKQPRVEVAASQHDFVKAHLLSASGSGRWQLWQAAVAEFDSHPLVGGGAGSYAAWWAQHGTLAKSIQDAHSLYLQTLGELGAVGLAFLVAFVLSGLATIVRTARAAADAEPWTAPAAGAAFCAFLLAAGIDWMWELTAVAVVGIVCLGLALVLAGGRVRQSPTSRSVRLRLAWRAAVVVTALAVIAAEGVPLLTQVRIGQSQSAARRGNTSAALSAARAAVRIQPWAATPYLQLALVEEQTGALASARADIRQALTRDPGGWQLELVAARLEVELGDIAAARRSYERARSLNPRSPLFAPSAG